MPWILVMVTMTSGNATVLLKATFSHTWTLAWVTFPFAWMAVLTSYQKEEHPLLLHGRMTAPSSIICQDIGCSLRSDIHLNRQYQPERICRNNGNISSAGWRVKTASSGRSLLSWANDNTSRGGSIGPCPVASVGACPCFMDKSQEHCLVIHRCNFCTSACER